MNQVEIEIKKELELHDMCMTHATGISMEPILHHRKSTIVLERIKRPLEKWDVVLFQRMDGTLVLHRIVKVLDDEYRICGDNTLQMEPVKREDIIGIMTGFYPDEGDTYISCTDASYLKYVRRQWWIRYAYRWVRACGGRILRRLRILKTRRS